MIWPTKAEIDARLKKAGLPLSQFAVLNGWRPSTVRNTIHCYAGCKAHPRDGSDALAIMQELKKRVDEG